MQQTTLLLMYSYVERLRNLRVVLKLEKNGNEEESFSKCSAYNMTVAEILEGSERNVTTEKQIIECEHGWEYDTTWYSSTAPSDSDWVCDKSLNVNNAFACGRVGDFLGTLIFGQLGDIIGRKPVFIASLALVVTGRLITAAATSIYPLFALSMLLSNSGANAVFQTLLAIGIEMSGKGAHSCINTVQYIAWTFGLSLLPFIQWGSRGWRLFMILTTVPTALFLFTYRLVPESPRWLTSKGRTKEASYILNNIAKANKRKLPANCMNVLNQLSDSCKNEKCYGIISLFSGLNMAKIITPVSYDVLLLNIRNLSGNPYLNFFYQSMVELPAYAVGMWMTDSIGRRWTQVFALLLNSFTCGGIILLKSYHDLDWFSIILVMFSKFCVSLSFYTLYLQSLEIYPTCIRQTGSAAGVITGSAFGVLAPYIVYLGSNSDARYPYVGMGALALLGAIASSFLPETMDEHLPETLNDARVFGKDQKYWHIPWRRKKRTAGIEMEALSKNMKKDPEM
ncbi:hypothetical protein J437_LFUL010154 [Ladona fulva]|uniref:Major facilitator superfamily (MFS) profile domain-containing protein n=1 Tax=Ladona fulva TaxID=123851 RepID=A0A8K0P309_LADFU|nr:hypothetical protein J437_LFUL010154 [Ladona fulva]